MAGWGGRTLAGSGRGREEGPGGLQPQAAGLPARAGAARGCAAAAAAGGGQLAMDRPFLSEDRGARAWHQLPPPVLYIGSLSLRCRDRTGGCCAGCTSGHPPRGQGAAMARRGCRWPPGRCRSWARSQAGRAFPAVRARGEAAADSGPSEPETAGLLAVRRPGRQLGSAVAAGRIRCGPGRRCRIHRRAARSRCAEGAAASASASRPVGFL